VNVGNKVSLQSTTSSTSVACSSCVPTKDEILAKDILITNVVSVEIHCHRYVVARIVAGLTTCHATSAYDRTVGGQKIQSADEVANVPIGSIQVVMIDAEHGCITKGIQVMRFRRTL
jgi:hypothetical protein